MEEKRKHKRRAAATEEDAMLVDGKGMESADVSKREKKEKKKRKRANAGEDMEVDG